MIYRYLADDNKTITSFMATLVPSLMVIFAVSYLYTRWVDQPSIAWAQFFSGRAKSRKEPLPEAQPELIPVPVVASISGPAYGKIKIEEGMP